MQRVQTVLKEGGHTYPEKGRRDRRLLLAYRNREQTFTRPPHPSLKGNAIARRQPF
jgi:hypothetical protein